MINHRGPRKPELADDAVGCVGHTLAPVQPGRGRLGKP